MGDGAALTTLWRPVGLRELELVQENWMQSFPPCLPEQPIFYPVLNFEYAEKIARDWNSTDARHDHVGFITEFDVRDDYLTRYETHQGGGNTILEYWIPAEDLDLFNEAIVGEIRVVAKYRHGQRARR